MTEASSGARAASTSRRSTEVVSRPRCSTTSTSSRTQRRASRSARSRTTASSRRQARSPRPGRWAPAATASTSRTTGKIRRRSTGGVTRQSSGPRTTAFPTEGSRRHGRLPKWGSFWPPSRPIPARMAACTRAATRIFGRAPTAGRRGRTRLRSLEPPVKWTSRPPTATTWSSPSEDGFSSPRTRSWRAGSPSTTSRATSRVDSSGGVAFDPNDPATIYAVLGGFSGFPGGHVFRTSLTATTWTDISPPLDLPFNAIAVDGSETPTALYTGTDFGVLRSVDGGASWSVLDDIHFPRAPVFELVYHRGELRVATFGRGVFSFVKPTGPSIAVNLEHNLEFGTVCRRPAIPDARNLQRRSIGSRYHERAAPDGIDRILRARHSGHAAHHRARRACRLHRALRPDGRCPRDRDHPHPEQRSDGACRRPVGDGGPGHGAAHRRDRGQRQLRQCVPAKLRRQGPDPQQQRHVPAACERASFRRRPNSNYRAYCFTRWLSAPATPSRCRCASARQASARRRPRSASSATIPGECVWSPSPARHRRPSSTS